MSQPMIVWCVIVGALFFAFAFNAVWHFCKERRMGKKGKRHFIGMVKEREIFYCPGDMLDDEDDL